MHNKSRIKPDDKKGIESFSQYFIRNSFSLARMKYSEVDSTVIYRSKMSHGNNKDDFYGNVRPGLQSDYLSPTSHNHNCNFSKYNKNAILHVFCGLSVILHLTDPSLVFA